VLKFDTLGTQTSLAIPGGSGGAIFLSEDESTLFFMSQAATSLDSVSTSGGILLTDWTGLELADATAISFTQFES